MLHLVAKGRLLTLIVGKPHTGQRFAKSENLISPFEPDQCGYCAPNFGFNQDLCELIDADQSSPFCQWKHAAKVLPHLSLPVALRVRLPVHKLCVYFGFRK